MTNPSRKVDGLIEAANYLDRLEGALIGMDADMKLPDDPLSPSIVADRIRQSADALSRLSRSAEWRDIASAYEACAKIADDVAAAINEDAVYAKERTSVWPSEAASNLFKASGMAANIAATIRASAPPAPDAKGEEAEWSADAMPILTTEANDLGEAPVPPGLEKAERERVIEVLVQAVDALDDCGADETVKGVRALLADLKAAKP